MSDRYGVVGNPIAHSQSPLIHRAFARALGDDIEYERMLVEPDTFVATVVSFRSGGGRGLNVTVPLKLQAFALATQLTERALQAGAVNTLKFDSDTIIGDNTDGAGLVRDMRGRLGQRIAGTHVLLMGAGGAARGAMLPLLRERPARVVIANRTPEKAQALAAHFAPLAAGVALCGGSYGALRDEAFDIVINATSASLDAQIPAVGATAFAPGSLGYDMVYGDRSRPFLQFAQSSGAANISDGLGMLVEQAAESYLLWRGVRPSTAAVLEWLLAGSVSLPDSDRATERDEDKAVVRTR